MRKTQELKVLNRILKRIKKRTTSFLRDIDSCLNCHLNNDFEYVFDNESVGITIIEDAQVEEYWRKFLQKNYDLNAIDGKYDGFLYSVMHEVGHHFTYDLISEKEHKRIDFIKNILDITAEIDFLEPIRNYIYFHLKDEKMATDWGVEFILCNQQECDKYWNDIRKYLQDLKLICGDLE